jgi:excisionase family DNA binding protein
VDVNLTTRQLGWVLGRSDGSIRTMIRDGQIEGVRLPGGFRIPRDEVLRVARETIEDRAGRKLSDRRLEELIDEVIATNRAALDEAAGGRMRPVRRKRGTRRTSASR